MGRDKALLPHHNGGCWLEHQLSLLASLGAPVTLLSGHSLHLEIAQRLPLSPAINALEEPAPWQGPLLALHRLMEHHPNQGLLLAPVDMPGLTAAALQPLLSAAASEPQRLHLAHDGQRLQPLLGYYPSLEPMRLHLAKAIAAGERRLQAWLNQHPVRSVRLEPGALRNINTPEELTRGWG